jgi:hypothetical protein
VPGKSLLRHIKKEGSPMQKQEGKFVLFDVEKFASWLAASAVCRVITLVQNHHTWKPSYAHFHDNHFQLLRGMERAHLERGFAEIAQHLTTFPDGTVAVCRCLDKIPAGIKGANRSAVCIEHVGNFDLGRDSMSEAHGDTIVRLNALLCNKFALTPGPDRIIYHHWYDLDTGLRTEGSGTTKSCPGTGFFGGNSVADANAYFIPRIAQELQNIDFPQPEGAVIVFSGTVTADVLNVRDKPLASGRIVKQLSKGITFNAYEQTGTWLRIHPSASQWVNRRFVEAVRT